MKEGRGGQEPIRRRRREAVIGGRQKGTAIVGLERGVVQMEIILTVWMQN